MLLIVVTISSGVILLIDGSLPLVSAGAFYSVLGVAATVVWLRLRRDVRAGVKQVGEDAASWVKCAAAVLFISGSVVYGYVVSYEVGPADGFLLAPVAWWGVALLSYGTLRGGPRKKSLRSH